MISNSSPRPNKSDTLLLGPQFQNSCQTCDPFTQGLGDIGNAPLRGVGQESNQEADAAVKASVDRFLEEPEGSPSDS